MSNRKFQITKQSADLKFDLTKASRSGYSTMGFAPQGSLLALAESGFDAVDVRNSQVVIGSDIVKHFKVIGKPHPRLDGRDSVTGRAIYTVDVALPAMLHAKLFRSTGVQQNFQGAITCH